MPERARAITDIVVAAILMTAAGLGIWGSLGLPGNPLEPIGPAPGPRTVGLLVLGLSLAILVGALGRLIRGGSSGAHGMREGPRLQWGLVFVVLSVAYVALMDVVGFGWASVGFCAVFGMLLVGFDVRRLPILVVIAVVIGIGSDLLFTRFFFIDLP